MLGLTADQLLQTARDQTGLTDLGDDRFLPAFRKMIAAINADTRFSEDGRTRSEARFLRLLVNRLRAAADFKAHPEILDEVIVPPLIILGLPRTGSTKLQRMIGQTDDFRGLLMWQGYNVAPFPDAKPGEEDPRIEDAARFLSWRSSTHAGISKAHHTEAKEPEEELYLVEMSFTNWAAGGYYEIPEYLAWIRSVDRDYVFKYVREMLQYMQWQHYRGQPPKPWILKTPPNLGHEGAILKHFPGAHFVMLHRDVRDAIPSLISLGNSMRHQYIADPPSLPALGAWLLDEADDMLKRHMAWRDSMPNPPVIDVAYDDVLHKDMETVQRIYDFAGVTLQPADRAAMQAWSEGNGQHRHGEHIYSLEGTGLTEEVILARLADYRRRFAAYLPSDKAEG